MVANFAELQKLNEARKLAQQHSCFVLERGTDAKKVYLLYRKGERHNMQIGSRRTPGALLALVKQACQVTA